MRLSRARRLRRSKNMNPILGLDFGRARIGVAISDELQLLAHPLETIPTNQQPAARSRGNCPRKKNRSRCGRDSRNA